MGTSLPFYRPLTTRDIKSIDHASRQILERIGIKISGSDAKVLSRAPSRFTLYSRDGKNDLHLGDKEIHFGNGGRVFRILDMGTGGYRLTLLRDVANTATIVDNLAHLSFYVIACQAHDIKPTNYHLLDFYYALNHTTKHVVGGCDNLSGVEQMWKLATIISGGEEQFKNKPFISVITNPISPLTIETTSLSILNFCITHGIPATCAPAPMAGATSPATLAGTLCQMHAESLAGVAIAQVLSPGAKVLYGAVPSIMDLRTMELAMGSVEMGMMNAAAVQMAKLYNLPIYASAGITESKRPDIQAGFEETVSNLTVALTGADFIHLAAGMIDSGNSISYEQFIIDNEIIGMIRRILSGIKVNKETLGLDVIESVGPRGNFVTEDHTINHMMDEFFYPNLSVRCNFDIWEERGRPNMLSRATEQVKEILDQRGEGLLDHDVISEIKKAFPGSKMI